MPDLTIPDGFGEAKFIWQVTGRTNPITTTLGFSPKISHTPDEAVQEMWDAVFSASGPCSAANMRSEFTFIGVEYVYNDGGVMVGGATTDSPIVGTADPTTTLLVSSPLLIQKKSALIGRRFRGRFYFPNMTTGEGAVDHMGNISSSAMSALHTIFDDCLDQIVTNDTFVPVILHTGTGPLPAPTVVTGFNILSKTATQRRRLRA